ATVLFVGFFGKAGVSLATLVMTISVLLLGEITPKTLAKEAPEQFAMFFAPLLNLIVFVLSPVNRLISLWKRGILRLFRIQGDRSVTEQELLTFVGEVRQEGGINEGEENMIRKTIKFDDITANDIFTPRIDVVAVSLSDSMKRIDKQFHDTGYSRLPVYKDSIDNIVGVMLLKDFHHEVVGKRRPPHSIIKPVVFITKSMKIAKLLKTLQEKKSHLAVVVDEFGGTMGIITVEDIVEQLVGEIWDEHDEVVENIISVDTKTYRILGNTSLEDMVDFFSIDEEDEKNKADYHRHTTIGNWVIEQSGGVPQEGDLFTFQHLVITVSKILRNRVMEVMVTLPEVLEKAHY
ncbi:MAG: hemolysin family protein, partial [Treponema sp.]|nr:hemolysin family protein [Treponema sp.]